MPLISSSAAVARKVVVSPPYWPPFASLAMSVHSPTASSSCSARTVTVCAVCQFPALNERLPGVAVIAALLLVAVTVTTPPTGSVERRTRYVRVCPSRSAIGVVWSPGVFGSVSTSTPTSSSATVACRIAATPL